MQDAVRAADVLGVTLTSALSAPRPWAGPDAGARSSTAAPAVIAVVTGSIFAAAGLFGLLALLLPVEGSVQVVPLRLACAGAVVIGAVSLALRRRRPAWSTHLTVGGATAMISLAVLLCGSSQLAVACATFYIFVALDCGLFFARRAAALHLSAAIASCIAVLATTSPYGLASATVISGTAVVVALGTAWLVSTASAAEQDPLTGLPDRRRFDRAVREALAPVRAGQGRLCVALIDLDHFKAVNDTLGHAGGDDLLREVATAWQRLLRPGDVLARQGGDEFALLLPGRTLDEAVAQVDALRAATPQGRT